jgi:hypothetical protein
MFLSQGFDESVDIPMHHYEAMLQHLRPVLIDCAPAAGCSYHLAVLQLSAVLTTMLFNSCKLSYHGTGLYCSCQQFMP